jgi:hypothetical protein
VAESHSIHTPISMISDICTSNFCRAHFPKIHKRATQLRSPFKPTQLHSSPPGLPSSHPALHSRGGGWWGQASNYQNKRQKRTGQNQFHTKRMYLGTFSPSSVICWLRCSRAMLQIGRCRCESDTNKQVLRSVVVAIPSNSTSTRAETPSSASNDGRLRYRYRWTRDSQLFIFSCEEQIRCHSPGAVMDFPGVMSTCNLHATPLFFAKAEEPPVDLRFSHK